jgi:hypothetical protein
MFDLQILNIATIFIISLLISIYVIRNIGGSKSYRLSSVVMMMIGGVFVATTFTSCLMLFLMIILSQD